MRELNTDIKLLRQKAMSLPESPGVYLMKNQTSKIIYVGKAKKLKNRVSQYFGSQNRHSPKVLRMVQNVKDFDYIICDSEFEALVLECSLIKEYTPKYNVLLKDDKGYSYIRISNEQWPRISAVYKKENDDAKYIGPFMSSFNVTRAVDEVSKIFMLPTCLRAFPADFKKSRPCLNAHIGRCSGVCTGRIKREDYIQSIKQAERYLNGEIGDLLSDLKKQMSTASENLEFERAAVIRDKINAINKLKNKQKVVSAKVENQDVIAFDIHGEEAYVSVLTFAEGKVVATCGYPVECTDEAEMRAAFILSYYSSHKEIIPPQITVDGEVESLNELENWLSSFRGKKVKIHIPQKGVQLQTVQMCKNTAHQHYLLSLDKKERMPDAVIELGKLIGTDVAPRYIEAYDISHTAGSDNVGGMIVYRDGRPFKSAYKRFKIKDFEGQDDTRSMYEVLLRRFEEYKKNNKENAAYGFGKLPDLILLDGGKGQLSAALRAAKESGVSVNMLGMVKDDKHRTRALVSELGEIELKMTKSVYKLIYEIQEEVHRFAIGYHRSLSGKKALTSELTFISGIGEARAKALLSHFKTVKAIKEADVSELLKVKGMNKITAQNVYSYFHIKLD